MSYIAPDEGEMLFCTKTGVPVYQSASRNAPRSQTNNESNDHSLRDYQKGEEIGTVVSDKPVMGLDGNQFLKIKNWVWIRQGDNIWGFGGRNIKEYHENYVCIDDEPDGWIREKWRLGNKETTEQDEKTAEIEAYISKYSGVPKPINVNKRVEDNGKIHWDITFPNGNTVDYEEFKDLTLNAKITISTRDPLKPATLTNTESGSGSSENPTSSIFTTQNIILACGIVGFLVLVVFLMRRK